MEQEEKKVSSHIKQNNVECYSVIQKVGCFARSAMLLAEYQTGKSLTAQQINALWSWAQKEGVIDDENNLRNPAKLATQTLRELGDTTGRFYELGTKSNGKQILYPWAVKAGAEPDCFIQKIKQNGPSITHFRVVDKDDNLIEDPHDPEIKVVSIFYTVCYKYYEK